MTIKITPVNVAKVTTAVVAMLKDALTNVAVERSAAVNETPSNCPWVCVYRGSVDYEPGPLGFGNGYRLQKIKLVVLAQHTHASSGDDCEDLLEALVADVVGVLLTDLTLRGTVRVLEEVSTVYTDFKKSGAVYMQTAAVYLTATVPVSVSQV